MAFFLVQKHTLVGILDGGVYCMEYIVMGVIVLFVVWRMMPAKGVKSISTTELKNQLNRKDVQFIDVRTSGEFKSRNIRQFQNIPLNVLPAKLSQLKKDQEVIVICQSGMRSSNACRMLKKNGFTNVTNVRGGMSAWQ